VIAAVLTGPPNPVRTPTNATSSPGRTARSARSSVSGPPTSTPSPPGDRGRPCALVLDRAIVDQRVGAEIAQALQPSGRARRGDYACAGRAGELEREGRDTAAAPDQHGVARPLAVSMKAPERRRGIEADRDARSLPADPATRSGSLVPDAPGATVTSSSPPMRLPPATARHGRRLS
jgi:hypothetical protein